MVHSQKSQLFLAMVSEEELSVKKRAVAFDVVVILICLMSLLLCGRSLVRGWSLKRVCQIVWCLQVSVSLCCFMQPS